jgi:hypothetical protein
MRTLTAIISLLLAFSLSAPAKDNASRVIDRVIDLKGQTIQLESNGTLLFKKSGMIKNGRVIGHGSRIETDATRPLFQNVQLGGDWCGTVSDVYFYRGVTPASDWQIVANLMKFNEINFTRKDYYLTRWAYMLINGGDVVINGNGVCFHLPSDKGETRNTVWGKAYNNECIFSSQTTGHRIEINDVTFSDTAGTDTGYGSDVSAEKPVIYYYLGLTHAEIILNRVHSDGQGCLLKLYNFSRELDRIELSQCSIRTCQFAVEVLNITRDDEAGHLKLLTMDSCSVYRYPNAVYCGPISIVGREHGTDSVSFSHSVFTESNAGSIELSGVDHASFNGNECTNLSFYDGDNPPVTYECRNNVFNRRQITNSQKHRALSMGGRRIILSGNTYNILSKPYPFIELLQPWLVEHIEMTDNIINYIPDNNPKGYSCLFSIKEIKGDFVFTGNQFHSKYRRPEIDCLFPKKNKTFVDPSKGKIRITWR